MQIEIETVIRALNLLLMKMNGRDAKFRRRGVKEEIERKFSLSLYVIF